MNKYQNGKIYKIYNDKATKFYIGSTTKPLTERLLSHVSSFKKWRKNPEINAYTASFSIIKTGNYMISLIEKYPCQTKEELRKREQELIETHKTQCVNKYNSYEINEKNRKETAYDLLYERNTYKCLKYLFEPKPKVNYKCDTCCYKTHDKSKFTRHKNKIDGCNLTQQVCDICHGKYTGNGYYTHIRTIKDISAINKTTASSCSSRLD